MHSPTLSPSRSIIILLIHPLTHSLIHPLTNLLKYPVTSKSVNNMRNKSRIKQNEKQTTNKQTNKKSNDMSELQSADSCLAKTGRKWAKWLLEFKHAVKYMNMLVDGKRF